MQRMNEAAAAAILGRKGGMKRGGRKAEASRANGRFGGRVRWFALIEIGGPVIGIGKDMHEAQADAAPYLDGGINEARGAKLYTTTRGLTVSKGELFVAKASRDLAFAVFEKGGNVAWEIGDTGVVRLKKKGKAI